MKLAIFGHCAIDTITINNQNYEQIGGSACYCGITARQFKFDVDLFTKFDECSYDNIINEIYSKCYYIIGSIYHKTNKITNAINFYDKSAKLNNIDSLYQLGLIYINIKILTV